MTQDHASVMSKRTLRDVRLSLGLTLVEVAGRLEVDPSTLSRIERGRQWPTRDLLERIYREFPTLKLDDVLRSGE
jgi:transcriptional regulator with XRE-family HTH domain